ncbi:hypothetical protein Hanom_Chr00s014892g01753881 [Helianthus anomalus]
MLWINLLLCLFTVSQLSHFSGIFSVSASFSTLIAGISLTCFFTTRTFSSGLTFSSTVAAL